MAAESDRGITAGLRGSFWDPARVPDDVALTVHPLRTQDGQTSTGFLLARGGERVAAVLAHPREHNVASYLAAELLHHGCAVLLQAPRLVGNDIRLEHEIALYDLAAATSFLHGAGYRRIVSVGNSGGGPFWAFYNQQSLAAPDQRISRTPGGRPTKLADAEMVPLDGLIFVSAHLGQGRLLMNCIDPSLTDEHDALSVDPALDPFSEANGFIADGATYHDEFVTRYRAAQVARVARIDEHAKELIAQRAAARQRAKEGGSASDRIRAAHTPIFQVWRTDADLRAWDLSIDRSDRRLGGLWGANPMTSNYGSVGFARVCTAESWLSTWSGLSSNASMELCAPAIEQPALMIEYTGDPSMFPSDNDRLFTWIGSTDKRRQKFKGDHHGRRLSPGDPDPRPEVGACMGTWLAEHFPQDIPRLR